jgi:hypothetical protein
MHAMHGVHLTCESGVYVHRSDAHMQTAHGRLPAWEAASGNDNTNWRKVFMHHASCFVATAAVSVVVLQAAVELAGIPSDNNCLVALARQLLKCNGKVA